MSETATYPKLDPTLILIAESASPTLKAVEDTTKTAKAKKLANALLIPALRNCAKRKHQIALSDEECINIINALEDEINNIKENDPELLDQLFDKKIKQLLEQPRAKLALQIDDSGANIPGAFGGLEAALEAEQPNLDNKDEVSGVDAALVADSTSNTNQKNINFLALPLRTSRETLIEFAKKYAEKNDLEYENVLKRLNMASAIGKGPEWEIFAINDYIIRNMDFSMYWEMRSFQMQRIQEELTELLNVKIDDNGDLKEKNDISYKIDRFIRNPFKDTLSEHEKKVYLQKMLEFLQGVSIEVKNPPGQQEEAHITKTYDKDEKVDLVTITENQTTNKMNFSINPELLKDSSDKGQQRLVDAIELSIDQATRLLERNQDKGLKLKIEGYEDSPEMVLRIFYSAKLHGHSPTIDKETTLKFWQEQQNNKDISQEERERYANAIKLHKALDEEKNIQKLRKYENQIVQERLGGHGAQKVGSTSADTLPSITPASPSSAKKP